MTFHERVIKNALDYAKKEMSSFDPSHDFTHIIRVLNMTRKLAEKEHVGMSDPSLSHLQQLETQLALELCAVLHDVCDRKYCENEKEKLSAMHEYLKDLLLTGCYNYLQN